MWSQAGAVARQGYAGHWWASIPRERWPQDSESLAFIAQHWQEGIGDARQELVFIGIEMDEDQVRSALDHALLTPAEMAEGPANWVKLPDPVPEWFERDPVEA